MTRILDLSKLRLSGTSNGPISPPPPHHYLPKGMTSTLIIHIRPGVHSVGLKLSACSCELFTFCDVSHDSKQKPKTGKLQSVQYRLEIVFNILSDNSNFKTIALIISFFIGSSLWQLWSLYSFTMMKSISLMTALGKNLPVHL